MADTKAFGFLKGGKHPTWRLLGLALGATPGAWFAGLILLVVADGLYGGFTALEHRSRWLAVLISLPVSFALALIYVRRSESRERRQTVEAMVRYWKWREDTPKWQELGMHESAMEENVEEILREWASGVLRIRPDSEYPRTPFELVDRKAEWYNRLYEKDHTGGSSARDFEEGI